MQIMGEEVIYENCLRVSYSQKNVWGFFFFFLQERSYKPSQNLTEKKKVIDRNHKKLLNSDLMNLWKSEILFQKWLKVKPSQRLFH